MEDIVQRLLALEGTVFPNGKRDDPWDALGTAAAHEYCDLALSGISHDGPHTMQHILQVPDYRDVAANLCTVYRDVDSAIVVSLEFPWRGTYEVKTTFPAIAKYGIIHAKASFQVASCPAALLAPDTLSLGGRSPHLARPGRRSCTLVGTGRWYPHEHLLDAAQPRRRR